MTLFEAIGIAARVILAVSLSAYLLTQVRRPTGWAGRAVVSLMNRTHSALTAWALDRVRVEPDFRVLDVGCGGGRTIERLAALASRGHVSGIDYASGSVVASRRHNAALVAAGRVDVQQASVSQMPFPVRTFDLVTAIETHYYWPNLEADIREVLRVLKPGGRFLLVAEHHRSEHPGALIRFGMKLIRAKYLTAEEHRRLFLAAGFSNVELHTEPKREWICVTGTRP